MPPVPRKRLPAPPPPRPEASLASPPPPSPGKVVGVVVNAAGGYSRGVLRGVSSFATARAWTLRVVGVNETDIDINGTRWDGALVQASTLEQARLFSRFAFPVVNISSAVKDSGLPTVITDDVLVGRLGADHFLRLGFRSLVFYGPDSRAFSKSRHEGFRDRAREGGIGITVVEAESELETLLAQPHPARDRSAGPVGVMGCNDRSALAALDVCRKLGLRVPDDVAVLGVDDDDLVQSLAYLPLSTVNTARDRVGFEAAALLENLMSASPRSSKSPPAAPQPVDIRVAPKGITARRSTDSIATSDTDVADAARFIHANAGRPISVDDVARASTVSRRQLERRFRASLGRSILSEIVKCRIDRARQLLMDTDLTLEQVAFASGFASGSYFSVVFKHETKVTPQRFRDTYRAGK